jgi:putative endonuclease
MRDHLYFVYILASRRNGTLYVGVTNDVMNRTRQHKEKLIEGFTKKHGVHILVWFEMHGDIREAIAREKRLKRWNRAWKIKLIEENNSGWNDLYGRLLGEIALPDIPGITTPYTHLSSPASRAAAREGDPGGETIAVLKK